MAKDDTAYNKHANRELTNGTLRGKIAPMKCSSKPHNGPGDSARRITLNNPKATAEELLQIFNTIQALSHSDNVIAYFQTASAAWAQCAIGSHFSEITGQRTFYDKGLERQANLLEQMMKSCVSRMVSLCLEREGPQRRKLYRKFKAGIAQGWTPELERTLKKVPLWWY